MRSIQTFALVVSLVSFPVLSASAEEPKPAAQQQSQTAEKPTCEHGVQKSLCTRCNPKLAAVFKAKNYLCAQHERPESQCSLCHPDLAKKGVK